MTNGQSGASAARIAGAIDGVDISGTAGTVTNFGTITGISEGVSLSSLIVGGSVINGQGGASSALISGGYASRSGALQAPSPISARSLEPQPTATLFFSTMAAASPMAGVARRPRLSQGNMLSRSEALPER